MMMMMTTTMIAIHFSPGYTESSWRPALTSRTNTSGYWFNWRVLICSIWVFSAAFMAGILIWKYEGSRGVRERREEAREKEMGTLYEEESWKPCLKGIHPVWLLIYRVVAFFVLLGLLIVSVSVRGGEMFYYYTQWTFALVTIYFGIGSLLSMHGCYSIWSKIDDDRHGCMKLEGENIPRNPDDVINPVAGFWGYTFQIIYHMNAGAVMLTDCVFWLIIVPFLAIKDYSLNFFMIGMHSVNAIFLLGDTALNSLRFPWFRISYFFIWTVVYVIFQWVLHASTSIWWPYPFLDLSSTYAPVWYFFVAMMHLPCYAIFSLIIKSKHIMYSRFFPQSYTYIK